MEEFTDESEIQCGEFYEDAPCTECGRSPVCAHCTLCETCEARMETEEARYAERKNAA